MDNNEAIALLVREAREIDANIRELTEAKTALVERIKKELGVGGVLTVDGVRASVRPGNRSFSLELGLGLLPDDIKLTCVSTAIDPAKVRSAVEAIYGNADGAMKPADPSKTILDLAK